MQRLVRNVVGKVRQVLGLRKPGQLGKRRRSQHTLYELMR